MRKSGDLGKRTVQELILNNIDKILFEECEFADSTNLE